MPGRFGDPNRYSPASYISAEALPILLIQGTADRIVRVETTDAFVEKMKSAGAKDIRYERIDGGDHGVAYEHYLERSFNAINRFLADVLKVKSD